MTSSPVPLVADDAVRVAVGSLTGRRSGAWRIWFGPQDIFAGYRSVAHIRKASIHYERPESPTQLRYIGYTSVCASSGCLTDSTATVRKLGCKRAATLRQVIEELRTRQANLQRGTRRQAQAKLAAEVPAEEAYKAAVAEMAATLEGSNVEAARVALRSLIGTAPVFENAGKLYGRIGVDPMPLYRRNPSTFGVMVAGGRICTEPAALQLTVALLPTRV
jgi:hypothetical protein